MPVRIILVALAVVSLGLIVAGVALIYPPAGFITAGVLGLAVAYSWAYLAARGARKAAAA